MLRWGAWRLLIENTQERTYNTLLTADKIHEGQTTELKEITDKFLKSVDKDLAKLNKMLLESES
jgi:hypothetical protein